MSHVRDFFAKRKILEVDTPLLSHFAPIDIHIDVMEVLLEGKERGFLHTSPEYAMKRLLAQGLGDIYQMSHVFRAKEIGPLHNPEFTMVEWYRVGFTFHEMIKETLNFIDLFLPGLVVNNHSYHSLLKEYANIDYLNIEKKELAAKTRQLITHLPEDAAEWDQDTLLNCLMSFVVEPHLGKNGLSVVEAFPASQAALSKTAISDNGEKIAMRFEVYFQGIELANGYHELSCAKEQRHRLVHANQERIKRGKNPLPIDENLVTALEKGLPDCCGVAVGFDRLMMLRQKTNKLAYILPFSWEET